MNEDIEQAFIELSDQLEMLRDKYGDDVAAGSMMCKALDILQKGAISQSIHYELIFQMGEYIAGASLLMNLSNNDTLQ